MQLYVSSVPDTEGKQKVQFICMSEIADLDERSKQQQQ